MNVTYCSLNEHWVNIYINVVYIYIHMFCFHGYPCLCHKNHGHDRQQAIMAIHIKLAAVKLDIHAIWEIHRH